jgi:acyl carrier protein
VRSDLATNRADAERAVAAGWREVLGVESVGLDDNFFDLGGNSLRAVELYAKLRDVLSVDLSVVDLFKYPTIRSLIDATFPAEAPPASLQPIQERATKQRHALNQRRPAVFRRISDHA